jgi:hypothetical protein
MWDPRSNSEVSRVKRTAITCPVIRAAAEVAQPGDLGICHWITRELSGIEILYLGIRLEAPTLKHYDAIGRADEFSGDGDARGTCTNDAEICLDLDISRKRARINQQDFSSSSPSFARHWINLKREGAKEYFRTCQKPALNKDCFSGGEVRADCVANEPAPD